MTELSFAIVFESVLGSYDRTPPEKPEIIEIEISSPELIRTDGLTWEVT